MESESELPGMLRPRGFFYVKGVLHSFPYPLEPRHVIYPLSRLGNFWVSQNGRCLPLLRGAPPPHRRPGVVADHDEPGACRGRCPDCRRPSGCSGCPNFCSSTEWCSPEQASGSRCFVLVGIDDDCLGRSVPRTAPAVTCKLLQARPRAVCGPPLKCSFQRSHSHAPGG